MSINLNVSTEETEKMNHLSSFHGKLSNLLMESSLSPLPKPPLHYHAEPPHAVVNKHTKYITHGMGSLSLSDDSFHESIAKAKNGVSLSNIRSQIHLLRRYFNKLHHHRECSRKNLSALAKTIERRRSSNLKYFYFQRWLSSQAACCFEDFHRVRLIKSRLRLWSVRIARRNRLYFRSRLFHHAHTYQRILLKFRSLIEEKKSHILEVEMNKKSLEFRRNSLLRKIMIRWKLCNKISRHERQNSEEHKLRQDKIQSLLSRISSHPQAQQLAPTAAQARRPVGSTTTNSNNNSAAAHMDRSNDAPHSTKSSRQVKNRASATTSGELSNRSKKTVTMPERKSIEEMESNPPIPPGPPSYRSMNSSATGFGVLPPAYEDDMKVMDESHSKLMDSKELKAEEGSKLSKLSQLREAAVARVQKRREEERMKERFCAITNIKYILVHHISSIYLISIC